MQPVADDRGTSDVNDDRMRPSCETPRGRASPPQRIVTLAQGFGRNGIVQSICEDDYAPAIDAIVDRIAPNLGAQCLPQAIARDGEGHVACDLIWELPPAEHAAAGTPTACEQIGYDFLLPLRKGERPRTADDRARCRLPQLALVNGALQRTTLEGETFQDGWYYDDQSDVVLQECRAQQRQRIGFTPNAHPPTGVRVVLDCAAP
jgi:hypothetical protein